MGVVGADLFLARAPPLGARRHGPVSKLPVFLKQTKTDPFDGWFEATEDATSDGIRVVRSVLGAIRSLPIVAFCQAPDLLLARAVAAAMVGKLRSRFLIYGTASAQSVFSANERGVHLGS